MTVYGRLIIPFLLVGIPAKLKINIRNENAAVAFVSYLEIEMNGFATMFFPTIFTKGNNFCDVSVCFPGQGYPSKNGVCF